MSYMVHYDIGFLFSELYIEHNMLVSLVSQFRWVSGVYEWIMDPCSSCWLLYPWAATYRPDHRVLPLQEVPISIIVIGPLLSLLKSFLSLTEKI